MGRFGVLQTESLISPLPHSGQFWLAEAVGYPNLKIDCRRLLLSAAPIQSPSMPSGWNNSLSSGQKTQVAICLLRFGFHDSADSFGSYSHKCCESGGNSAQLTVWPPTCSCIGNSLPDCIEILRIP
jgi:hypothetical protein